MHLLLSAADADDFLLDELERVFPGAPHRRLAPGLIGSGFTFPTGTRPPPLAFARQWLPEAAPQQAASVRAWSELVLAILRERVPEGQPWRLHVLSHYGGPGAGAHRCDLIRAAVHDALERKGRQRLRQWRDTQAPFAPDETLLQLLLTAPATGHLSLALAPEPFAARALLSPFPKGALEVARDPAAPCRAFAKLVEAEQRLGCQIGRGEQCVDLGAAPGSWSYVALRRGATVLALDRAPLRADLMRHPRLVFRRGDAFSFVPERPVDWLLCDAIAAPARSLGLLRQWVERGWTRHFVVTVKFKGHLDYALLDPLRRALPALTDECFLSRLCANKNEVCAFGSVAVNTLRRSPTPGIEAA